MAIKIRSQKDIFFNFTSLFFLHSFSCDLNFAMDSCLDFCLKFYNLFGFFLNFPINKKTIREKVSKFWSFAVIIFNFASVVFFFSVFRTAKEIHFYIKVLAWCGVSVVCLTCIMILFDIIRQRNNEETFWRFAWRVENISRTFQGVKRFNLIMKFKISAVLIGFILAQLSILVTAIVYEDEREFKLTLVGFIPKLIIWIFTTKFMYYVDVLSFVLQNLPLQLSKYPLTKHDLQNFSRSYAICWRMSQAINEIFAWGLVCTSMTTFLASFQSGHNLCKDIKNGEMRVISLIQIIVTLSRAFVVSNSCENCLNQRSQLASSVFSINSKDHHEIIESLGLQLQQQMISFEPFELFTINHKNLLNVRL